LDPDANEETRYFDAAENILRCLITYGGGDPNLMYLAKGTNQMALLINANGQWTADNEQTSFIWGDYYFLEALQRYEDISLYGVLPEPATLCLMMAGLGAMVLRRRRIR
jgi:hypothetical protein